MDLHTRISQHFTESAHLKFQAVDFLTPGIVAGAERIVQCLLADGKVLACGNGGSAADAQHFSAEMLNRFEMERPGLAAITLTTDASTLTSIANDYDFVEVFSKQVRALGHAPDVLLAISTSGNSPNIVAAVEAAHERGMTVIALTGKDGGRIGEILAPEDIHLCAPGSRTAHIQEIHITAIHCLCDAVDCLLLGVE
ncbi:MAG: phosphoheptose isomerase [Sulfuricella sp.]|nr:phosphoheptose isomerase [Sulfuricella sp.]